MAHSLSAKKRIRQNVKHNARNRGRKSAVKTLLKVCQEQLVHGAPKDAETAIYETVRELDRAGNRRTIHRNAAARRKSRLMRKLNAMKTAKAGA